MRPETTQNKSILSRLTPLGLWPLVRKSMTKRTWALGPLRRLLTIWPSTQQSENRLAPATSKDQGLNRDDLSDHSARVAERLKSAAENGDPFSQNQIALGFAADTALLRDDQEARTWLRRAAQQGYAEAQFNLGNLCQSASLRPSSTGVAEARIEAYVWFYLAAAQGHPQAAASCEALNLQLTDAELAEGNRRARAHTCTKEVPNPGGNPTI